jgi:hypothetical protein
MTIQLPDGSVIRLTQADEQVGIIGGVEKSLQWTQNLRQRFRIELGRSASATGQGGEADLFSG